MCDGYGIWGGGGGGAIDRDTMDPSQPAAQGALMTRASNFRRGPTLTPGPRVSSEEQIYLEWFIHGTAATPPRIFNSLFWDPAILQAAAHEPMILQALLALSVAHKRHVLDPVNRTRVGIPDALEIFLLKHYGSAIKGLQNHMNGGEKIPKAKWFAAVTMCVILVLLSLLRGRFEEAYVHLKTGAHIAKQFVREPGQPDQSPQLVRFFVRLGDQTTLFRCQSSGLRSIAVRSSASPTCKLRFASSAEAGHYLDDLIEIVAYLAQQTRQVPRSATAALATHHDVCRYMLSGLESWLNACNATTAECGLSLTPSDAAAYEAMRQRHKVTRSIAEKCIESIVAVETQEPQ